MIFIPGNGKSMRKRERMMRPARVPSSIRREYRDNLLAQVKFLKAQTANLSDIIKAGADRATVARTISAMAAEAQARFDSAASTYAPRFVDALSRQNRASIEKSIARVFGVDAASIVDGEDVAAGAQIAVMRNVSLIQSISAEHFANVAQAVMDNYRGVPLPGGVSLQKRLQELPGMTANRAKFIARDQTSKIIGDLNQIRMSDNGIEEYVWRTARDERVVGTPGGRYPHGSRGHEDHYRREGVTYKWSNPPGDGHPGQAYNCRCYAEPKLNIDKLKAMYV